MASLIHYAGIPVYGKEDAEKLNDAAGFHFFEGATLRFFHSRISESFYPNDARKVSYFVTSEQNRSFGERVYPRLYTVRAIDWTNGNVRTIGEFQQYATSGKAQRAAKAYADGAEEPGKSNDAKAA